MPAWSEARQAGQRALGRAQAERAAPGGSKVSLPQAKERFKQQVCVYCRGRNGAKVGNLAITGPVVYCKNHAEQYKSDKAWEEKYKLEMGL